MSRDRRIAELASVQHGLITTAQLRTAGVPDATTSDWATSGRLERVQPAVYRVAGSPRTWVQSVMAAQLAGGPTALAAHRCSAALHRLDGVTGRAVELLVERHDRRGLRGVLVHETLELPVADLWRIDGVAVTAVDRTLIDVGRYWHPDRVGRLLDDAVRRRLTTYERFADRVATLARRGRPGITTARTVLAARDLGDELVGFSFEDRMLRLIRSAGLPPPNRQVPVDTRGRRFYVDLGYPEAALGIECDSTMFHTLPHQFQADLDRQNAIVRRGVLLLRFTNHALRTRPADVVDEIEEAFGERVGRCSWPTDRPLPRETNMR